MLQNFPRQLFHHEGGVGWYDETKNDDYGSITHLCEIDGDDNDEVGDGDGMRPFYHRPFYHRPFYH